MEFYNATFPEAVKMLTGEEGEGRNSACPAPSPDFRLPEKEENNDRIIRYLTENRGIEKIWWRNGSAVGIFMKKRSTIMWCLSAEMQMVFQDMPIAGGQVR